MTLSSWIRGLASGAERSRKRSRSSALRTRGIRHRLSMERLEDRTLLSANFGLAFALPAEASTGEAIAVDANSNFYVAGSFSGAMDADPAPDREVLLQADAGSGDAFVAKYDAAGGLVWARQMGGTSADIAYGVAVDELGNVHVTGSYEGTAQFGDVSLSSTGSSDVFVTKLDVNGNFLWAEGLAGITDSGSGYDLALDDAGNVYTTGSVDLNWPLNTIVVMKHDASGQRQWVHKLGGDNSDGFGITVDDAGNSFITGHYVGEVDFDPGPGTFLLNSISYKSKGSITTTLDAFVLALDPAGSFRWAGSMGSTGDDQGLGIALDGADNLHVTGQFGASLFTGDNPPVSGSDFDPGSGTLSLSNAGSMDIFAVKLTGSGDLTWGRSMGGPGWDYGYGAAADSAGDVYLTGGFGYDSSGSSAGSTADLDPGPGTYTLSSAGYDDVFVSKLDSNGDFAWAAGMGGSGEDNGYRIAVDGSGVYTTGVFQGQADFDPGDGAYYLTSTAYEEAFVSKLTQIVPPPSPAALSISDVTVIEGNSGTTTATFIVTRSGDSSQEVTVDYVTTDGSATADVDYAAASGTLALAAGETSKTITVLVTGDRLGETDETFFVNLSGATNALIDDSQGVGAVADDEPRMSISDVQQKEGRKGTTLFTFTVTLSTAYDQEVSVSYATMDGSALVSDGDYMSASGMLTFAPGETSKTITIEVNGDRKAETNEMFYLDLFGNSSNSLFTKSRGVGTILNDDR